MEKIIVEDMYFIKESKYQEMKQKLNKIIDYFTIQELQIFTKKVT